MYGLLVPRHGAYLGMILCGASRMARHARAQKAYAPWASAFGWPEMPPSKVWPGGGESRVPGRVQEGAGRGSTYSDARSRRGL